VLMLTLQLHCRVHMDHFQKEVPPLAHHVQQESSAQMASERNLAPSVHSHLVFAMSVLKALLVTKSIQLALGQQFARTDTTPKKAWPNVSNVRWAMTAMTR
jgi:hypothetical protein